MAKVAQDLTIVYITANVISDYFSNNTEKQLWEAAPGIPTVIVSHRPMNWGSDDVNLVVDMPRSQASIYRQVLIGAKEANTKYVAIAEDDVLYSPEHFKFRPKEGHWGYNMNPWSTYTWGEPMFTYRTPGGRRVLNQLICDRQMLIDHLEERFSKWTDETIRKEIFGEPGKYDNQLGTTPYPSQAFYTNPPNIVFSHQTALGFEGLGTRKRVGDVRAIEVPYWGRAEDVVKLYG